MAVTTKVEREAAAKSGMTLDELDEFVQEARVHAVPGDQKVVADVNFTRGIKKLTVEAPR